MSSKSINPKFVKTEYKEEEYFNVKRCIIPFSLIFPKEETFIYDGTEKIPFKKRDPRFRAIFLHEFFDNL